MNKNDTVRASQNDADGTVVETTPQPAGNAGQQKANAPGKQAQNKKRAGTGAAAAVGVGGMVAGAAGVAAAASHLGQTVTPPKPDQEPISEDPTTTVDDPAAGTDDQATNTVGSTETTEDPIASTGESNVTTEDPIASTSGSNVTTEDPIASTGGTVQEADYVIDVEDVIAVGDVDEDGLIDVVLADINGNEKPDMILDTDLDGELETVVLDVEIDENGELVTDEDGYPVVGEIAQNVTVGITDEYGLLDEDNLAELEEEEEPGTVEDIVNTATVTGDDYDYPPVIEDQLDIADIQMDDNLAMDTTMNGSEM